MKPAVLLLSLAAIPVASQEVPVPAEATSEHRWLQQLVGEWEMVSEATMEPGAEPMIMESTQSVRSIGGLWFLVEGSAEIGGRAFTSLLTLGYDTTAEAFIGTWVDSTQTHMWSYRGSLDEARKVLTLETEGPSVVDPTKTGRYRDTIEVLDPDRWVMTSSAQGEDGTWTLFMRAEHRRKR